MTGLTQLCVHDCASRPARPSLRSPRALTSFLFASVYLLPSLSRRYLDNNLLTGSIPTEIGQLTGLVYLCVHGGASRPARPSLRPRRALTSLLPASVLSIPRSPLMRSLRDAAQALGQQPAHRSDPNRNWPDGGAPTLVRARLRSRPLAPPSAEAARSLRCPHLRALLPTLSVDALATRRCAGG